MTLVARDISKFTAGSAAERKSFARDLLNDYKRTGFAKLINHDISASDVEELFALSKQFFRLPLEVKDGIAHQPGPKPQRGWSAVGAENASRLFAREFGMKDTHEELLDCREHFDMGAPEDVDYPNKFVEDAYQQGFQATMEKYFERLARTTIHILEALEVGLEIPAGTFTSRVSNSASEFRLLHYPAVDVRTIKGGKVNRIWPHFDLGVITLLFQDKSGGLEIQERSDPNTFVPLLPESPVEMVTNISETLQRWSNDAISAGLHQVTVPAHMKELESGLIEDRYSIAFFCKADRNASVGPLSYFVTDAKAAAYSDVTAIEYQQYRLQAAY